MQPAVVQPPSESKQYKPSPTPYARGTAGSGFEPHTADVIPTLLAESQQKPAPA
jgi:hypothetical protein